LQTASQTGLVPVIRYERDPAAIYRQSFAIVQKEARLERFPDDLHPLVTRLIHACGMTEIADRLAFSEDVVNSASNALQQGAAILCDCEMVRSGIIARNLPAIGNAPTALFHLLELLDKGWPKPAAILGFPVGFVGAAESKAALAANPRAVPFITLKGRKGGSAMASAAVNAIAAGLEGHG